MYYSKHIILLFILSICSANFLAQERTHEVNHVISKKASKGYLYDYLINEEENRIELAYALKETPKKLVMETYFFKLDDLSFIESKEEEFEKEKVKYKRVKRSKEKPIKLLKVSSNILNGKLKLHKGHVFYWSAGRAILSKFVEEETVDVRTSEGEKFIYVTHRTEGSDFTGHMAWGHVSVGLGNVKLVGLVKEKPYYAKYGFTIYDAHTLTEKMFTSFDLEYSYAPISVDYLPNGDVAMVLQPLIAERLPQTKGSLEKFNVDPEKNFRYIQLNTVGEVVSNVKFKLDISDKGGLYNIGIAATDKKNEVVLFGVGKPDAFSVAVNLNPKAIYPGNNEGSPINIGVKADKLVIVKITNGKLDYNKQYDMSEIISNPVLTADSKAPGDAQKYIKAGNLTIQDAIVDESGNVLLSMKCGDWHHGLQLSPGGDIMTNYFDNTDQDLCVTSEFMKNGSNESFWINYDMPKPKDGSIPEEVQKAFSKRTAVISKVNTSSKKLDKTMSLSPEGISLDEEEAIKVISKDELLILGNGKKKEISLSRMMLN